MDNACTEPLPSDARACIHLGGGVMHRRWGEYMALPVRKPYHPQRILHPYNQKGVPLPFDVAALTWKQHGRLNRAYPSAAAMVSMVLRWKVGESRAWLNRKRTVGDVGERFRDWIRM